MTEIIDLSNIKLRSFDWDKGNINKNWKNMRLLKKKLNRSFLMNH